VEAIRHAQAAQDWALAARLLSDHWFSLDLDGQATTAHELLTEFPASVVAADAELTALTAADELNRGSLQEAERHLALAAQGSVPVSADRRGHLQVMLATLRLYLARQRGDLPTAAEEAERLLAPAEAPDAAQHGLGADLRALALINLGIAECWAFRLDDAERHLGQGLALAHRIGRPYLEITGLAHLAQVERLRSLPLGAQRSMQAIELARQHGWAEEPVTAVAYVVFGATKVWQGRLEEAERCLDHAERAVRAELEPMNGLLLHHARGTLELARGRDDDALAAFRVAERLAELVVAPHPLATQTRAFLLSTHVRLGETGRAEAALARLGEQERQTEQMHIALAALRLAQNDPQAATAALAPVLDSAPVMILPVMVVQSFLLEAIARDTLGDTAAAGRALERALDIAEPDGMLFPFLLHRAPGLLERHARHRTAHAALISQILALFTGSRPASPPGEPGRLREPLSDGETRVLRYLPANLTAPEIAGELCLSVNTVRTHMRHIYVKLSAHRRHEAVERARALGLLAPSPRRP
jgi:LuxR family maltose regulon positive regulatory protein